MRSDGSSSIPQYASSIFYRANMEGAQAALPIQVVTPQDVQNALNNTAYMKAIGAGIGNTAAHELAHQFLGQTTAGMDDTSQNTYNGIECSGYKAPWMYGVGAIQWESITATALKNALGKGWHY